MTMGHLLMNIFASDGVQTAIIAAVTSIITFIISFIIKPRIEQKSHQSKVEIEHEYEQRKKIKEVLSTYKTHVINAADSLKGRLNNLSHHYNEQWLSANGDYSNENDYYFQTTVYRILNFYAWSEIIEKKLIYLDTTIATESDLNFIKYLKAMKMTLQRGNLVKGIQEESKQEKDIIFRDTLDEMSFWMIKEDSVLSYTDFKNGIDQNISKYKNLCQFLDNISPEEDRRRWDRLYCLHLLLVAFLNTYGYDFQNQNNAKTEKQITRIRKYDIFPNLITYLEKYKLSNEIEIKKLTDILRKYIPKKAT